MIRPSEDAPEEFVALRHPTLLKELRTAYHEYLKEGGITQKAVKENPLLAYSPSWRKKIEEGLKNIQKGRVAPLEVYLAERAKRMKK